MSAPAEPLLLLLGPPAARPTPGVAAQPLASVRQSQLLLMLALRPTRGWTRGELAARLWPQATEDAAARNLRKVLFRLRADGGADWVRSDGQRLVLAASTDLQAFEARWQGGDAAGALALMRGALGAGLPAAPDDDELAAERQHWLGRWRSALARALPLLAPDAARQALQRWLEHEPGDEAMRRQLDDRALRPGPQPALPALPVATLGREGELEDLALRLSAPGSVAGLLGPGGIGKTTLARAAAQPWEGRALWVACQGLADAAAIAQALLRALGQPPAAGVEPQAQANAALARGTALLVLDALEDAAADPALPAALAGWRAAAPELRVLWTARLRPASWPGSVLGLGGLEPPDPADPPAAVARSPAVRLLVQEAQRSWPGFDAPSQAAALGRIARAVGGHPLALVVAAGWVGLLPADAVAHDVEQGDATWSRPAAGLAEGSLAAMLDRSLALLGGPAADALACLAVFPEGFDAGGAKAVADVGLVMLSEFVRHGLLRAEGSRFHLHALVARHAWARLAPAARQQARRRHALALAEAAAGQARRHGAASAEALRWARLHAADLRAAWQAVLAGDTVGDDAAVAALAEAWVRRCDGGPDAAEAIADLGTALQQQPTPCPARLRALRARLLARVGQPEAALAAAEAVQADASADARSRALASLAAVQAVQLTGDWAGLGSALTQAAQAIVQAGLNDLQGELEVARLTHRLQVGPLPQAELQGRRTVAATRRLDGAPLVMSLLGLAYARRRLQRHPAARESAEEALQVADRNGLVALRLRVLAELAALHDASGALADSERLALSIVREAGALGERNQQRAGWLIAGVAADRQGQHRLGLQRLAHALDLALELRATSAALGVVHHAAHACANLGHPVLSRRLMRLVDEHPATWAMHHDRRPAPATADEDPPAPALDEVPVLLAAILAEAAAGAAPAG